MASYSTSDQKELILPARTYYGCPDTPDGKPTENAYSESKATIGPKPATAFYTPVTVTMSRTDPSKGRPFKKARDRGEILMSPYSVNNVKEENFLFTTNTTEAHWRWEGFSTSNNYGCKMVEFNRALALDSYRRTYDLVRLRNSGVWPEFTTINLDLSRLADIVNSTQTSVYAEALSGYDILTELAESRETINYVRSKVTEFSAIASKIAHTDEQAWKRGRRKSAEQLLKSADRALRKLGGRWMEYRYAIMPLFYSLRDIGELLDDNGAKYQTNRKTERIQSEATNVQLPSSGFYLERQVSGQVRVSSMTKARYDLEGLTSLYARRIASNPFSTAWELVPLSFVVDWFFNVGDSITAASSIDFSSQRASCTVTRSEYEESIFAVQPDTDPVTLPSRSWEGKFVPEFYFDTTTRQRALLRRTTVNNYDRVLFTKPDFRIQYDPFLNWKRFIDAAVLSYQPTKNLLRSLK